MANFNQHLGIGAATGAVTYLAMCKYLDRPFDLGEMLGCMAVSTAAAVVPDIVEPALTPNHRGFAHSLVTGSALARVAWDRCGDQNQDWEQFEKILFASAAAGYLSHLVADGCTPRSLPLLG